MTGKDKTGTEIKRLPSGFWAVCIGGIVVDAASPSEEAAQAKLDQFLKAGGKRNERIPGNA